MNYESPGSGMVMHCDITDAIMQSDAEVKEEIIMISSSNIRVQTRGDCDIIDITHDVAREVESSEIISGTVTLFVAGFSLALADCDFPSVSIFFAICSVFRVNCFSDFDTACRSFFSCFIIPSFYSYLW